MSAYGGSQLLAHELALHVHRQDSKCALFKYYIKRPGLHSSRLCLPALTLLILPLHSLSLSFSQPSLSVSTFASASSLASSSAPSLFGL